MVSLNWHAPPISTLLPSPIIYFSHSLIRCKKKLKLTEEEIKQKVDKYIKNLDKQLCDLLVKERQKEEEREALMLKTTDELELKRLKKLLAMERAQGNERIVQMTK